MDIKYKMKGLGVGDIGPVAIAVTMAIIVVALATYILATMSSTVSEGNATAVIGKGLAAMSSFADWFAIIIVVVVAVIVIGLVMLLGRGQGRS